MPDPPREFDENAETTDVPSPFASHSAAETSADHPDTADMFAQARLAAGDMPETIGQYRIEHIIGEGGMGAVYRARQNNPDREVALKLIRAGFITRKLLKRFELEAQLLGRLQHPGIAQIYEAGTFESARGPQPFFAMELVKGEPLDHFAKANRLDTRARLELFAKICDAVDHAHANGIIHRDLKPGNIFVTGDGQPKVLDFGVARATDSDIQATTIQTDVGQLIGTVPYMSPEQVTGEPGEIDTRSDVYALGVVLYQLLAGKLPYDLDQKMIHEAARVIREDDPTPLSSINKTLRGDVDTIVAKALAKEKDRRYQSAADLAADIRRHLTDVPIVARPPSTYYQLSKFARRNRALVGGVIAVFVVLVAGVIVSTSLAVRATKAEMRARSSLGEAEATVEFLDGMLAAVDPGEMGKDVTVRAVLDRAAKNIDSEFTDRPLVAARLHSTVGRTYLALGVIDEAPMHIQAAHDIRLEELGPENPLTLRSAAVVADMVFATGRLAEGERLSIEAIAQLTKALGREHPYTLHAITRLATNYGENSELEKALPLVREAALLNAKIHGPEHIDTIDAQNSLAMVLADLSQLEEAKAIYDETLEIGARVLGLDHPSILMLRANIGWYYYEAQQFEEAIEFNKPLLEDCIRVFGERHPNTGNVMNNLAVAYNRIGELEKSEVLQRRGLEISMEVLGESHPSTLISMTNIGAFLQGVEKFDESLEILERSVELHREVFGNDNPGTAHTLRFYAGTLEHLGRFEEAEPAFIECYDIFVGSLGPNVPILPRVVVNIVEFYDAWGKPGKASAWRARLPEEETADDTPSSLEDAT